MAGPARVLVVDDSPTILKVVSAILSRNGYETAVARDGATGMDIIRRGVKFDLILLDFVMPRMNGYQFCRELRGSPHRALPVVLMSAKGDKIRGQFVQQTGAVDAITKPFDARALVAVIEGALAKTTQGRARAVPEGRAMPEEDTIAESVRPSLLGRRLAEHAAVAVASDLATVVSHAILALPPEERSDLERLRAVVAETLSSDVLKNAGATLRELAPDTTPDEVMSGDLAAVPLAEILQVLQMQRQSGLLRVTNHKVTLGISIRQGHVDLVSSRGASDEYRLGRYFVEKGLLTREELDAIVAEKDRRLLGEVLVERGTISQEDLTDALGKQSSELVYDVLRWPYGRFSFTKEPPSKEAEAARLALGISGLVLEGFRRVDEWRLMEGTIHFDQVVAVDTFGLESLGQEQLTRTEQRVLAAIDGARTVSEIIRESAVGSFDAVKALYQFLQSRVVRPKAP
jgi:CheY-like chemotaxis protein